ncbi:hypothetical protein AB4K20DRAFT_2011785 [Rhizopus microsporus]
MRKVFRPSSLLRLISSRNGSKRTRSRMLNGYLNDSIPLQAISSSSGSPFSKLCQFTPPFICVIMLVPTKRKLRIAKAFYLGRSRSLHVDRLIYLLSQAVALDCWQDKIKAVHDFGGFRLTANEENKGRTAYCIDYDVTCSMVEQLEENVYQCRSFTEDILFYEMDTKEGFLKNCSCPDQTNMCKHIFLVSRVTKLPFSPHAPVPVVQQERFLPQMKTKTLFAVNYYFGVIYQTCFTVSA